MEDNYIEELKNKMAFYEYFYKKKIYLRLAKI